jgi:hypothetical protein
VVGMIQTELDVTWSEKVGLSATQSSSAGRRLTRITGKLDGNGLDHLLGASEQHITPSQ